jgi:hypothetical protein
MRKMYFLCLAVLMAFLVYSPIAMSAVPVTSGLVLQLDTSDVNTTTRGGVTYVTSWTDQSGNNNDANQATEARQPVLVSNITPAGGSAIKFDGTDDYFSINPNSTFDGGNWTMFAVYAVDALDSSAGSRRLVNLGYEDIDPSGTTKAGPTTYTLIAGGTTSAIRATSRTIANSFIAANSGLVKNYGPDIFYLGAMTNDYSTTSITGYIFNSAGDSNSSTATNSTAFGITNTVARIGAGTTSTTSTLPASYHNGWVAEILIYNRVLTPSEITSVKSYLLAKHMPPTAYNPTPANGGTVYDRSTNLKWTPANGATSQTLYFSTDQNSVINAAPAALKATLAADACSYGVGSLQMSTTYYWKINQVVNGSTVSGSVWSFTLTAYYSVENFERYIGTGNSTTSGSLRATWKDGYSLSGEGLDQLGSNIVLVAKTAGTDVIVDPNMVRTLNQSMLFAFDNTGSAITFNYPSGPVTYTPVYPYAEAKVSIGSLPIGTDWTIQGDWDLILYFYGKTTNNTNSPLYLAVEDATGHVCTPLVYPTSSDIAVAGWHTWTICSSDLTTNGVNLANLSKLYVGFGNRTTPQVGGKGVVYFDDIRMHRNAKLATDFNQDCKVDFKDFSLMAEDWLVHAGCVN